jgi:hypothetical protein
LRSFIALCFVIASTLAFAQAPLRAVYVDDIARHRVIGPVSNLSELQEAFHCKAGAPMVRPASERCRVC